MYPNPWLYASYLETVEITIPIGGVFAELVGPDMRRIAIRFDAQGVEPVGAALGNTARVSTEQTGLATRGYQLAFGQPLEFNFNQHGPITGYRWYAVNVLGVPAITVTQLLLKLRSE